MQRTTGTLALVLTGMVAALVTLGGCGVTAAETGGNPTPLASPTASLASPTASTEATGTAIVRGLVTVTLGKTRFMPTEAITVSINNGLSASIFVADHQTRCSLVTIEQQSASGWQAVAPCRVLTPIGMVEIKAGTSNIQQVMASGQPPAWLSGTYRVQLAYSLQRFGSATIIYSGLFTVA